VKSLQLCGNIRGCNQRETNCHFANNVLENNGTQIAGEMLNFAMEIFTIKNQFQRGTYTILIKLMLRSITHQEFNQLPANKTIYQDFGAKSRIGIGEVQVLFPTRKPFIRNRIIYFRK